MQLTIKRNGPAFVGDRLPPAARKIKDYLDSIPEDERGQLMLGEELAKILCCRPATVGQHARDLPQYTYNPAYNRGRPCRVWGHPDAIAQLVKQGGVL